MQGLTAEELIAMLHLIPHPSEGGFYRQTYRSSGGIPNTALPSCYAGARAFSTAIYFLLTPETFSAMHRLPTDEVFHFYMGDPVDMLQIAPDGTGTMHRMGHGLRNGEVPQLLVPGDYWQGSILAPGGKWALLGTTVAPGFEFADYEHGKCAPLVEQYPAYADRIRLLTRD